MKPKKLAFIFGTRPDTIKLAPVILEARKDKKNFKVINIATAQHRSMLDQVLKVFKIKPDYDLNIMKPNQTLAEITTKALIELDKIFEKEKPDMVVVQGDTTTTFAGSLAAFYKKIPVAHVEAGLRTYDKFNPYPEEINRKLTGNLTELHFPPTQTAKDALKAEKFDMKDTFIAGNTVIDALKFTVRRSYKFKVPVLSEIISLKKKIVLITLHRRESWGKPMEQACEAIKETAKLHPNFNFVFPVHMNPTVREVVFKTLKGQKNIFLIEPLDYIDFVNFMARTYLILTDSGGIQEEGPHFGIPVLVVREVTERPEAVKYGTAKLVGLNKKSIFNELNLLIGDKQEYKKMANSVNPYGDGFASVRILKIIKKYFRIYKGNVDEFVPKSKTQ